MAAPAVQQAPPTLQLWPGAVPVAAGYHHVQFADKSIGPCAVLKLAILAALAAPLHLWWRQFPQRRDVEPGARVKF